ncbi:MAG: cell division protein FtsI (penicillin-binding protein 3), partial [Bradymonadia bacterium]
MTESRPADGRLSIVVLILALAFLGFVLRSYHLQVAVADEHLARGDWRVRSSVTVSAPRGSILDRNGRVLAADVELRDVFIDPRHIMMHEREHLQEVRAILSELDDFDAERFEQWRAQPVESLPRYVVIARGLSPRDGDELLRPLRDGRIRGVGLTPSHQRVYPLGALAAPVIGFVNREHAGGAGLEGRLHSRLAGGEVEVPLRVNQFRVSIMDGILPEANAARGDSVTLTLDADMQSVAEESLAHALEYFEASAGTVVAMDPRTGAILAIASLPSNDPVDFNGGPESQWLHRAVAHVYEPGSTAKVFTFAAALEERAVGYNTTFDCNNGVYIIAGRVKRDHYCHDTITAWEVIRDSSNIGAIGMSLRLEDDVMAEHLRAFGFGERLGIDLPGESAGIFPALPWRRSTQQTVSYGYGIGVTPLQLTTATATLANGGVRMDPYLVSEIRSGQGDVLETFEPREVERAVSERAARLTARAMETVTTEDGTASAAAIPGFSVAGKTGTAFLVSPNGGYTDDYLSAFTGFVPAEDPVIAISVIVERPNPDIGFYGGAVAAPVFRDVAIEALVREG